MPHIVALFIWNKLDTFYLLMFLAAVPGSYVFHKHYRAKVAVLLKVWGDMNHFKILDINYGGLWQIPPLAIMISRTRYQAAYHVSMLDESSQRIRTAWFRLGSSWGKLDLDNIVVVWDDH